MHPKTLRWGYWFGGALCLLSLVSLSLGIAPLLGLRSRLVMVQLPGQQTVDLKLAGGYLAFCMTQGLKSDEARRIPELQFSLTDASGRELPIVKIPPPNYASDRMESQLPLFQTEAPEPGPYTLNSAYPLGGDGPKVNAALVYMDVNYIRRELIAGILVCLILAGAGLYCIRKTYVAGRRLKPGG